MPDEHRPSEPTQNPKPDQPDDETEPLMFTVPPDEGDFAADRADSDDQDAPLEGEGALQQNKPPFDLPEAQEDDDAQIVSAFELDVLPEDLEEAAPPEFDSHDLPTMPFPQDSRATDPKKTLLGSDGYDPNPDFMPESRAKRESPLATEPEPESSADYTMPHIVPFQHTMVHVPGEREAPRPSGPDSPTQYPYAGAPQGSSYMPPSPIPPPPAQGYSPENSQALPRKKARPRKILGCSPGCFMIFIGLIASFCGGLTLIMIFLTATLGAQLEDQLQAQVALVDDYENFESTFYYDRGGTLLYEAFGEGRRTNVRYEDFPQDLINATIATEDENFFSNPGFDPAATARAMLQYFGVMEGGTGGSTITQQLVRNVLFDFEYRAERSIQRKVEEILLAFLLNQRMSKEDILEMYLNEIYYGNLSYGAEAAAQTLFSKSVGQLTLGEAALLAGLPQTPAHLDPLNPDPTVQAAVEARWRVVLDRMVAARYITTAQRDETLRQGLSYNPPEVPLRAPHFTVYAQQELERLMGEIGYSPEQIARGGLRIYTTVDLRVNDLAQNTAATQVAGLAGNNVSNAAVLVLKPVTGEILAMVGSVDYNNENIDGRVNVTIAPRQPGSTMKPFTYSAAMEQGLTPGDIIWDTPTTIGGYTPVNYDRTFHGPVRMRTALANSYNVPAVQTLRQVGVESLLEIMYRFGVTSLGADASRFGLSLTLGGGELSLLELTSAYSVFANGGAYVPVTSILCVVNSDGDILYQYEQGCPRGTQTPQTVNREGYGRQVLDSRIAYLISDILGDNAARTPAMGANSPMNTGGLFTSVKTGTTDDFKDNWTIGYTRNVAVGVWVGNSRGEPMVNSTGLTGAAPIWNAVMTGIHNDNSMLGSFVIDGVLLPDRLDQPSGMSLRSLCNLSTLREPALDCGSRINEWFLDGPAAYPDAEGNMQYPPAPPATPEEQPQAGPWLREIEPDLYQVLVQPIPPDIANSIVFSVQPGQPQPPPPLYCQVPIEVAGVVTGISDQLFIAPPPVPEDAVQAEQYARNSGLPFLPTIACTPELLSAGSGPAIVTAYISQPTPGQVITDNTPVIGTAQFSPEQALYYKLELGGGQFGGNWVTMGDVHYDSVINGQLEVLPGPGLSSGNYVIRLVVVGHDGNFVQPPYEVPFIKP